MTTTLTAFLLARIAEDEAVARSATQGSPSGDGYGPWRESFDGDRPAVSVFGYPGDRVIVRFDEYTDQDHVIRWQPERVLAECEAKRRIVDDRTYATEELRPTDTPGRFDRVQVRVPYAIDDEELLGLLALPYADHPDYRQEWKP